MVRFLKSRKAKTLLTLTSAGILVVCVGFLWWAVTQHWSTYRSEKFVVTFQYPNAPYRLTGSPSLNAARDGIQLSIPDLDFWLTVQMQKTDIENLDAWLAAEPDDLPKGQTYYGFLRDAQIEAGGYIASTTVDGIVAVETGFDCQKIGNRPEDQSPWRLVPKKFPLKIITIYKGIYYEFDASDMCHYAQGLADFRKMVSTVTFRVANPE